MIDNVPADRARIVAVARGTIGTPFHHQARLVGVGIDCVGLLVHVAKTIGIPHVDVPVYSLRPNGDELERILALSLNRIPVEEASVGDVLCFWIRKRGEPQHVSILTAPDRMIHTYADVGRVVEHGYAGNWPAHVSSAWRYPGVV